VENALQAADCKWEMNSFVSVTDHQRATRDVLEIFGIMPE